MPLYLLGAMLNKNMIICIAKRFNHSSFQLLAKILLSISCVVIRFIIKNKKPDLVFKQYSYFQYCIHAPVITLTGMVYDPTLSILFNYEIVKYFTVVILAYIVCVLSAQFIERFSLDAGVL